MVGAKTALTLLFELEGEIMVYHLSSKEELLRLDKDNLEREVGYYENISDHGKGENI